jgi:hypothetical protein
MQVVKKVQKDVKAGVVFAQYIAHVHSQLAA